MKHLFFMLAIMAFSCEEKQDLAKISDSLFVNPSTASPKDIRIWQYGQEFYTEKWEIKKFKTKIKDVQFCESVTIPEKEFYNKSTSFVGICTGIDTIFERHYGDRLFYKVKLNKHLKTTDSRIGCYSHKMQEGYYILAEGLTKTNKDSIFK